MHQTQIKDRYAEKATGRGEAGAGKKKKGATVAQEVQKRKKRWRNAENKRGGWEAKCLDTKRGNFQKM